MLRAVLRRASHERGRALSSSRKRQILVARQSHLDLLNRRTQVKESSAAKIQALKRGWDARVYVNRIRKCTSAATKIQRLWRGKLGRKAAENERSRLKRVVPTKYQMDILKSRCVVLCQFGEWQELRDPATNYIFFYHVPTGDSQWGVPNDGCIEGVRSNYHCTFEDCREVFTSLLVLEQHRKKRHKWFCDACLVENGVDSFPVCPTCQNCRAGSGRQKCIEYEKLWSTKLSIFCDDLILSSDIKDSAGRSTLIDLRPQSAVDQKFCKVRELVLDELEWRKKEKTALCSENSCDPEWPMKSSQRGPISKIKYERNMREKHEINRVKKKVANQILKKIEFLSWKYTGKINLNLGESKVDKEILAFTKGRPVTPSLISSLKGVNLHTWFETYATDNGSRRSKEYPQHKKLLKPKRATKDDPLGALITESFAKIHKHAASPRGCGKGTAPDNMPISSEENKCFLPLIKISEEEPKPPADLQSKRQTTNMSSTDLDKISVFNEQGQEPYPSLARVGITKLQFSGGAVYTGKVINGKFSGLGSMAYVNGDTYQGSWESGRRHGHGIFRSNCGKKYIGMWEGGLRHGKGSLVHPNGECYEGEWHCGKMSGYGTLRSSNGDVYEGQWLNNKYHGVGSFRKTSGHTFLGLCSSGKAHGYGILYYATGEVYRGNWVDNRREGSGVVVYPNGLKYVGYWKYGKFNGKGKLTQGDGETYIGDWFMGKREGYGKATFGNGDTIVGYWQQDKVVGHGIMYYANSGNVYDGLWEMGLRNGIGTLSLSNGGKFRGNFRDGKIHGRGVFLYGNGDTYKGAFVNGLKNGKGKFMWKNGNVYTGMFSNDKIEGFGTMMYAAGHSYKGHWSGGRRQGKGIFCYKNGNVYDGLWHFDQRHGVGKFVWNKLSNNSMEFYKGNWVEDKREGSGFYQYSDGSTYEGEWVNGVREGFGLFQYTDGSFYEGNFRNDKRWGHGTFHSAAGVKYSGQWVRGAIHGVGLLSNCKGDTYEGEFKDGKKHGDGVVMYGEKNIFIGRWENGRRRGKGQYIYQAQEDKTEVCINTGGSLHISVFGH